jgi:hypothetical protein
LLHAIVDGVDHYGQPLFPLMPSYALHNMLRDDALAIIAYLRSVPPVTTDIPARQPLPIVLTAPVPPIPDTSIPHTTLKATDPSFARAEHGRNLAGEIGVCMDCHSPWNAGTVSALDRAKLFTGGRPFSAKEWSVPGVGPVVYSSNLTPDPGGIAGWSTDNVIAALGAGVDTHGDPLCRPMPSGPTGSLIALTQDDATDIALYLTTLPANAGADVPHCVAPAADAGPDAQEPPPPNDGGVEGGADGGADVSQPPVDATAGTDASADATSSDAGADATSDDAASDAASE